MDFEFSIIDREKASKLRSQFIRTFVNTNDKYFHEYIETLHTYPDGECYDGYLWTCLLSNENYKFECNMENGCEYLKQHKKIYVMWDLFSNHRIFHRSKFASEYEKNTIIEASAAVIAQLILNEWENWDDQYQCWFPEDIYCFDDTMRWFVIFTHEGWDNYCKPELKKGEYIRICFVRCLDNE